VDEAGCRDRHAVGLGTARSLAVRGHVVTNRPRTVTAEAAAPAAPGRPRPAARRARPCCP
jgi:hypothetical protein